MKKLVAIAFVMCAFSLASFGQAPKFKWEKSTHDFGTIIKDKPVTAIFKFTNDGAVPLVITNAKGSCGCTGVKYPKAPIAPGETAEISATFNAASMGTFSKTVTVDANTQPGKVILGIKGQVVANTQN